MSFNKTIKTILRNRKFGNPNKKITFFGRKTALTDQLQLVLP